jgi:hypothetical protein
MLRAGHELEAPVNETTQNLALDRAANAIGLCL